MNYFKQVYAEMHEQPLAIWLSVAGTAISIFLVMAVFTISKINTVEVAPESNRGRIMVGEGMHLAEGDQGDASASCMSLDYARKLYGNLDGIEKISFYSGDPETNDANVVGKQPKQFGTISADDVYWEIFDFDFIDGRPYTRAESDAGLKVAVITEKAAREIFSSTDVVGCEFRLKQIPYRVAGVVKGANPLMTFTNADIFIPFGEYRGMMGNSWMYPFFGDRQVILLKKAGISDEHIKSQVRARYDAIGSILKKENHDIVYHETPYNLEEKNTDHGSNTTPDTAPGRRMRWMAYALLILLPAINLSGMTRSRIRRRVSEIGVRRAFGATRLGVFGQLIGENFIVTLIGGAIGFLLSVVFILFFTYLFADMAGMWGYTEAELYANPSFSMVFTWSGFAVAFLFCLALNLLSAGLPVFRASSVNPAEAISGSQGNDVK